MKDLYLYFSGTGNTRYVVHEFASLLSTDPTIYSIEETEVDFKETIQKANTITIGYPIYESMMPHIMSDFLNLNKDAFQHKTINVIVTQMLFSGDGANLAYKLLKKQGVKIQHTIHINMPNNLTDVSFFPVKNYAESIPKINKASERIHTIVADINRGKVIKNGRRWYSWFLGFFVQRLYALMFDRAMRKRLRINHDICSLCKKCVHLCPVNNLKFEDNKILTNNQCTLCYRCINSCPEQAISLFTKKPPKKQYLHPHQK